MTMPATSLELSERINLITVSSTMKVAADADRLRREGVDVVDFGAGEPDFPTPDNIKQAAIRALEQNFTKYTPAGGTQELKQAVCERHAKDFGTDYKPAECVISVGGKHIIFGLTQALLNPGDEVVIPVPYWVTYADVVAYTGAKAVFVPTDEKAGFTLTASMIEPYLTDRTRMVIINSPSNPSGAVIDREEFERILHLTHKRGIWLMTDECYCHFLYDSEPFSIASDKSRKRHDSGCRVAFQDLRDDGLAYWVRPWTELKCCRRSTSCRATALPTRLLSRRRRQWKRSAVLRSR